VSSVFGQSIIPLPPLDHKQVATNLDWAWHASWEMIYVRGDPEVSISKGWSTLGRKLRDEAACVELLPPCLASAATAPSGSSCASAEGAEDEDRSN
jgi:hypothetical protein